MGRGQSLILPPPPAHPDPKPTLSQFFFLYFSSHLVIIDAAQLVTLALNEQERELLHLHMTDALLMFNEEAKEKFLLN